jgi:hypothetical protein
LSLFWKLYSNRLKATTSSGVFNQAVFYGQGGVAIGKIFWDADQLLAESSIAVGLVVVIEYWPASYSRW